MRSVWFHRSFNIFHFSGSDIGKRQGNSVLSFYLSDKDMDFPAVFQVVQFVFTDVSNRFPLKGIRINITVCVLQFFLDAFSLEYRNISIYIPS